MSNTTKYDVQMQTQFTTQVITIK